MKTNGCPKHSLGLDHKCKACKTLYDKARYQLNKQAIASHLLTLPAKFGRYRRDALRRGITWELTLEEFSSYWQLPCSYCGLPIPSIGIDRVDSSIGYSKDNCISCCGRCNKMKLALSKVEWIEHMKLILTHMGLI